MISSDASGWDMYKSDENVKVLAERAKAYAGASRGSTFDFAGTAVELVRPLPSLQYVFVATSGSIAAWRGNDDPRAQWEAEERWHVSRAWRVAEHACGAGQPRLVELDNDVAETLIRTEELLLAKTDEVSEVHDARGGACQKTANRHSAVYMHSCCFKRTGQSIIRTLILSSREFLHPPATRSTS